jgi:3-oxoacyl-[acyl-carrier protein] reductase
MTLYGQATRLPDDWQSQIGSVADKIVLITGSTRGLGCSAAKAFAQRGACVAVHGRSEASAQSIADSILASGGKACGFGADLANPSEARRLVEATIAHFGGLDVLINNGAILPDDAQPLWSRDNDLLSALITNVVAPFETSMATMRWIMQAAVPGRIINISSEVANLSKPLRTGSTMYSISKIALEGTSAYLAAEAESADIVIGTLRVPTTNTDMIRSRYDWDARPPPREPQTVALMYLWAATATADEVHGRIRTS